MPTTAQYANHRISQTTTIQSGQTLSSAITLRGTLPCALVMPASWTMADIILQGSEDGITFYDIQDSYGIPVQVAVTAGHFVMIPETVVVSCHFLRLKSSAPQGTDREITVVSRPLGSLETPFWQSSGFSPRSLPSLALWLDAADYGTLTKDASNFVSTWQDKSGNGNHATQGTGAQQPQYSATGLGGKPTLTFVADGIVVPYDSSLNWTKVSCFVVLERNADSGAVHRAMHMWGTGFRFILGFRDDTDKLNLTTWDTTSHVNVVDYDVSNDSPLIFGFINDGSQTTPRINGTAKTAVSHINGTQNEGIHFGHAGSAAVNCNISEVLLITDELTAGQITHVEQYLASKWGIALG
ncbi:MAG: hypothetical protein H6908_06385 [Hyphomicrobiales bacterium]|nr:hypothetical protein [Hyphomicrobiales bacterium]